MRERMIPGESSWHAWVISEARYLFAARYVRDKAVLDVACGTGYGSDILARAGAATVTGIDHAREAIAFAEKHYQRSNLNFMVLDALELPFEGQIFDVIVSLETIEHLESQQEFLEALVYCLRPGGLLVISTPISKLEETGKVFSPYHVRELTHGEFRGR